MKTGFDIQGEVLMRLLGNRLEQTSAMVPAGGVLSASLPILALAGMAAAIGDFGMPGLEKALVAIGMFAAGVLMSRFLPVWREAKPNELERLQRLRSSSPAVPWIRMVKRFGLTKTLAIFLGLCAFLALLGTGH
jgi:hypothetical protein